MIYYLVTVFEAVLCIAVAIVAFLLLHSTTNDLFDNIDRECRSKLIQVGEIYEFKVDATPLKPEIIYTFEIKEVKDGYVAYVNFNYPNSSPEVESAYGFLKYHTKKTPIQ